MSLITDTGALAALCARLAETPFICLDTEFMRESTFWPKLCLVQIAGPDGVASAIDPLAEGIELAPLLDLLNDSGILKVMHAARQDLEIFYNLSGRVPVPLFDTQVAAMVCGFGEAAAYEKLARKLARAKIDKSSRFTDWSKRPLTDRQLTYALADVEHLPTIYEKLSTSLEESRRGPWVKEEMAVLTAEDVYAMRPEDAWRRIKTRTVAPDFLAVLREVAAARERYAQSHDVPRQRVLRDDAILEIAAHRCADLDELGRIRGMSKGLLKGPLGPAMVEAVAAGIAVPEDERPTLAKAKSAPRGVGPLVELLKVLLKMRCEENDVAVKLVASSADLERIAADDAADVPAMHGWRRSLFGDDALALKRGELALTAEGGRIALIELEDEA
ncbi:MAG: ribonuclease D [Alphaproteobacteria bacterium]|nr:ribonuclease D [Alphaproteobacteria bacterium]